MMTSYKLTYFEGERGRGEPLRMMLTLAGQQYDEENISIEKWMSGYKQGKSATQGSHRTVSIHLFENYTLVENNHLVVRKKLVG